MRNHRSVTTIPPDPLHPERCCATCTRWTGAWRCPVLGGEIPATDLRTVVCVAWEAELIETQARMLYHQLVRQREGIETDGEVLLWDGDDREGLDDSLRNDAA